MISLNGKLLILTILLQLKLQYFLEHISLKHGIKKIVWGIRLLTNKRHQNYYCQEETKIRLL